LQAEPRAARIRDYSHYNRRLPLHWACFHRYDPEIVRLLLEAFPDGVSSPDVNGYIPLHHACWHSHPSVDNIRLLIQANPQTISMKANNGKTPLHDACRVRASMDAIELLIQTRPTVVTERDQYGMTPLYYYACDASVRIFSSVSLSSSSHTKDDPVSWNHLFRILQLHARFLPELVESEQRRLAAFNPSSHQDAQHQIFVRFLKKSSSLLAQEKALQETMEWMAQVSNAVSAIEPSVVLSCWSQSHHTHCGQELLMVVHHLQELCADYLAVRVAMLTPD
jgi:hypothetical protein